MSLYRRLKERVSRFLRIPDPPSVPAGSPGSVRRFQPAPGYYRYRVVQWILKQVGALWGLIMGLFFVGYMPEGIPFWSEALPWIEAAGVATFVLQLPFSFFLVRLDFDHRWYLVTDRSLRIREGVMKVHEQTMSFANLQNLSIQQGPVQRLFGISDLQARTAGGGGKGEGKQGDDDKKDLHLAFFRGVENADEIRDLILAHLKRLKGSGLGDPDDARDPAPAAPSRVTVDGGTLAAARELLGEARALRQTVR